MAQSIVPNFIELLGFFLFYDFTKDAPLLLLHFVVLGIKNNYLFQKWDE